VASRNPATYRIGGQLQAGVLDPLGVVVWRVMPFTGFSAMLLAMLMRTARG
jgi:hypothetical protein